MTGFADANSDSLPAELRLFVSIAVPAAPLVLIADWQRALQKTGLDVQWTKTEQIHLTLKFLGNVARENLAELKTAFAEAGAGTGKLSLELSGSGAFPSLDFPRIVWVGIGGDVERLRGLQQRLQQNLAPWSAREENREFHPHLTVARIRRPNPRLARAVGALLRDTPFQAAAQWSAAHMELMWSRLGGAGPRYVPLAECLL